MRDKNLIICFSKHTISLLDFSLVGQKNFQNFTVKCKENMVSLGFQFI